MVLLLIYNTKSIGGSRGRAGARPPLQDPILSFSHTFSLKSAHVGSQKPPKMGPRPPTENPGSGPEEHNMVLLLNLLFTPPCDPEKDSIKRIFIKVGVQVQIICTQNCKL